MTTYTPEAYARRRHVNFWLVAVIALAAGLAALGTWTLVDRYTGSENGAAQLVDDLNAAVNAGDAEAVRALFARNAVFEMTNGEQVSGLDNVVNAALIPHAVGIRVERVAPVSTEGDFATTFSGYSNGTEGVELLVVELRDGKIVRLWLYDYG